MSKGVELKSENDVLQVNSSIKLLLTVEEAAQVLNICRSLMYQLVLTKKVTSIKIGRSRRVLYSALHEFVDQKVLQEKED